MSVIKVILDFLMRLFGRRQRLPYPEEPPDYGRLLADVDTLDAIMDWLMAYDVPVEWWDYWRDRGVIITVTKDISYAAGVWEENGVRHMNVRPEWLTPGVIAHEEAHVSYALLTKSLTAEFEVTFYEAKEKDSLVKLVFDLHPWRDDWGDEEIEGHADIYRYLGNKMPSNLKRFYPRLFDV